MLAYSFTFSVTVFVIVVLFVKSIRKTIAKWFFKSTSRLWFLPASILALYCIITIAGHSWHFRDFVLVAVYFILPIILIIQTTPRYQGTSKTRSKANLFDVVLVLLVWLPLEFEIVPTKWITIGYIPWPAGIFVTVFYILILLTGWRKMELFCPGKLTIRTFAYVSIAYIILAVLILPAAVEVGFIRPALNTTLTGGPGSIVFVFLGIFFAVAVPEEFLFRGWIQNLILTRMKFLPGLILSTVIFGLSHVDDEVITLTRVFGIPNWWYGLFATIAGIGYGYVYHKRKSIFASALLHALVDFTWVVFFAG